MLYALLANLVLAVHLAFILFVALGGLAVLRWPRLAWLHLPCVAWGVTVELTGWYCPLTPLENYFLHLAGREGYAGDFIQHYLLAAIYPEGLTREAQTIIGLIALALNLPVYGWLLYRHKITAANKQAADPIDHPGWGLMLPPGPAGTPAPLIKGVAAKRPRDCRSGRDRAWSMRRRSQ